MKEVKIGIKKFFACLRIFLNWQADLKILEYYGVLYEQSLYHYIKASDAKILLYYAIEKECIIPITTLKRGKVPSFNLEKLKKDYYLNIDKTRKELKSNKRK